MKSKLVDKNFILGNGIDYDELEVDYDRFGDKEFIITEGKETFFSGIAYSLFPNGNSEFYAFFKDGFKDGDFVEFYEDNKIKCIQNMKRGRTHGIRKIFYKDCTKKLEARYEYGVCLSSKEWNEEGVLVKEKSEPTEDDIKLRNSQEEWYKKTIEKE
ncbi:MAG: toxin-antitoxin system YwqK family antitoxin [Cellulosilyticaceae bacterium]